MRDPYNTLTDRAMEVFFKGFMWFLMIGLPLGLVALIASCTIEAQKPTFELKKDSWGCTATHQEQTVTYVSYDGGKTSQPVYGTQTVCDQWSRK